MSETNDNRHTYLNGSIEQLNMMAQEIFDELARLKSAPEGVVLKSKFETEEQYQTRLLQQ